MEIELPKMPKVGMNECRSLCSTQQSSGKLPKVSIGITVDKNTKLGSGSGKEHSAELLFKYRVSSFRENVVDGNTKLGTNEFFEVKKAEANDQQVGEWTSTKSVPHEMPTIYENRRVGSVNTERVEEVAFASMHKMHVIGRSTVGEKPQNMASCSNEALKMKLWEILGTAPSQNKQCTNLPSPVEDTGNLSIEQNRDYQRAEVVKPNQNSDPIETDSESSKQAVRRPITRSLTQKSAPTKSGTKTKHMINTGKKPLPSATAEYNLKLQRKNIFTFDEGEGNACTREWAATSHSSKSNSKKNEGSSIPIEPRRIYFPERSNSKKSLQENERAEIALSLEKVSSSQNMKTQSSPCPLHQATKESSQKCKEVSKGCHNSDTNLYKRLDCPLLVKNVESHENSENQPPKKRKHSRECFNNPPVPEDAYHQQAAFSPTNTEAHDDFKSPTLAMSASFPSPSNKQLEEGLCSPVQDEQRIEEKRIYSSGSLHKLRPGSCDSDVQMESSDDTREINQMYDRELSPFMKEKESEKWVSPSPVEELEPESFEADDQMSKGFSSRDKTFSSDGSPKKSPFILHHRKRCYNFGDIQNSKTNLASSSFVGTSGTEDTTPLDVSEQFTENSLASAVLQLAFVLERFKAKIKSSTQKKSSEITLSVAETIRQQLQDAESQIQENLRKLTSIGKSKRKHLESKFHEQQEKLRLIHDKFKEELDKHLLSCRSSLDELEAYQRELKENTERQKASHMKLLMQAEEATKDQLTDAEVCIAAIHKESRKKINGLRHVLKEWVGEGDIG